MSRLRNKLSQQLIDRGTEQAKGITICGVPLEELSREELIAAMGIAQEQHRDREERHQRYERFQDDYRRMYG